MAVELLHRTTHEFELTAAGAFLLERGPISARRHSTSCGARSARTVPASEAACSVAYGASASYDTAPRLVQALAERHPEVATATAVRSVGEMVSGLRAGSLDSGNRPLPTADGEPRGPRRFDWRPQHVLLRCDHPLASGSAVALADLARETLLLHPREANPGHYDAIVELCRSAGFEPRVILRSVSFDLAYTSIADSDAIAIIGESSRVGLPSGLCLAAAVTAGVSRGESPGQAVQPLAGRRPDPRERARHLRGVRLALTSMRA